MNLKEAEQCVQDVFGKETKVFVREDFISGQKRVLRPLEENETPEQHDGRFLNGERLVILGTGKTWEDALRGPISQEMMRRRKAATIRQLYTDHAGEMFAVFLRELYAPEFSEWCETSDLAKEFQRQFEERLRAAEEEGAPKDAPRA